jgi:hypothetical protein
MVKDGLDKKGTYPRILDDESKNVCPVEGCEKYHG